MYSCKKPRFTKCNVVYIDRFVLTRRLQKYQSFPRKPVITEIFHCENLHIVIRFFNADNIDLILSNDISFNALIDF